MPSLAPHVAQRIRSARIYRGVTQNQLADRICCTRAAFAHVERGRTQLSVRRLGEIARVLDLPISYFFANFNQTEK